MSQDNISIYQDLSANDIQSNQMSQELINKVVQDNATTYHILMMVLTQCQIVQKVGRKTAKTGGKITTSAAYNPYTYHEYGNNKTSKTSSMDAASGSSSDYPNPPSWFNTNVPDNELDAIKKLEKMLKWQEANFMNINGETALLQYMVNFEKKFPNDKGFVSKDLMETLMKNLIAETYVQGGDVQAEINKIHSIVSGDSFLDSIWNDFAKKGYADVSYYEKNYSVDGKPISWDEFLLKAGGDIAFQTINTIPLLINAIYHKELDQIWQMYLACKNPFFYYLALLAVIGDKEQDTEMDVMQCANMLKELSNGEKSVGNALSALSVIVNLASPSTADINNCLRSFYDEMTKIINEQNTNGPDWQKFQSLPQSMQDSITSAYTFVSFNGGDSFDYNSLSDEAKTQCNGIINEMCGFCSSNSTCNSLFGSCFNKIINDNNNAKEEAQELAEALLYIQQMGDILGGDNSIFPGLKEMTDKLLGDGNGDFYKLTGLTPDILKKAAYDDDGKSQQEIVDAIKKIVPTNQNSDTNSITTINNDLNQITSYFNDHNSAEQSKAQYIAANDQKMLSFMKQMYDQPTTLIKAIMQNLAKANQ